MLKNLTRVIANKKRYLLFVLVLLLSFLLIVIIWHDINNKKVQPVPIINGYVLPEALSIEEFSLINQDNNEFTHEHLLGQWHFITYGYTQCPDVCPTTLTTLAQIEKQLVNEQNYPAPRFIFYSIDPNRDTNQVLSKYINYFSENFIALSTNNRMAALAFEQSLGIKVEIIKSEKKYQVAHGLAIYVLNPEAKLQAVLLPNITELGSEIFTSENISNDFNEIKNYYAKYQAH